MYHQKKHMMLINGEEEFGTVMLTIVSLRVGGTVAEKTGLNAQLHYFELMY
jgi:hypothetical protein